MLPPEMVEALEQELVEQGKVLRAQAFKVCESIMEAVEHYDEHEKEGEEGSGCLAALVLKAGHPFIEPCNRIGAILSIMAMIGEEPS
jgi:hypothetical protein